MRGICPQCQTEVQLSKDGKTCLPHNVGNKKEGMPQCEGSFNTEPEIITEMEFVINPAPSILFSEKRMKSRDNPIHPRHAFK